MLVEQIMPKARERLMVVLADAIVRDAVTIFSKRQADFLVVCREGLMVGVLTKTDVLAQVDRNPLGESLYAPVNEVMSRDVVSCSPADSLADIWRIMQDRSLGHVPVVDSEQKPVGVVHIRDALQCLFGEAEIEDELLRDYISGVGYQ
jgi:CBS domain-containing protein